MGKRKVALTFAETSCHGDEDLKPTRRSQRVGHTHPQQTEPHKANSSDSDDDFVVLPSTRTTAAATAPTSSLSAQRAQRKQQRLLLKDQQQQQSVQRGDEMLRQQEEDDIMRAIELSKVEMEADQPSSKSQEEWRSAPNADSQEPSSEKEHMSSQLLQKPFASRAAEALCGPPQEEFSENITNESYSSSSSVTSMDCEDGTTSAKVERARVDLCSEWQDVMGSANWEDPSLSAGVANCDRGTRPLNNDSRPRDQIGSQREENSQCHSAFHKVASSQPSQESRRDRLRRRKRSAKQDGGPALRPEQPAKMRREPTTPPDRDETEEEEDDEIDVVTGGEAASGRVASAGDLQFSPADEPREVLQLVDTRKPHCPKYPFYAPPSVGKRSYTRVICQLIQAYCSQLRQAQAKVLTRIGWGSPVVTGNCYSDTLVQRKRGSRACTFYALSDTDSDSNEDGKAAEAGIGAEVPPEDRPPRPKRKLVVDSGSDVDSDFDDFIPAGRRKAPAQRRPRQAVQGVVEMLMQDKLLETLSPTLVADQAETQDFATVPGTACGSADSDLSQPLVGETPSSRGIHNPDDCKKSPHTHADSQSSLTDIFGASSNNDTDSGRNAVTSSRQSSPSPVGSLQVESSLRAEVKSESSCEEDSFDEEILTLNTSKLDCRVESVKACLQEGKSQIKTVDSTQDGQSVNHHLPSSSASNGHNEELLLGQQRKREEMKSRQDSPSTSREFVDPSHNYLPPHESASAQTLSFEELRYQFYLSKPALARPKRFQGETEGSNPMPDEHIQKPAVFPGTNSLAGQSQDSLPDNRLNVKHRAESDLRRASRSPDRKCKGQSPPAASKQSPEITGGSTTDDEEETTDCESLTDGDSRCSSRGDTGLSGPHAGASGDDPGEDGDNDEEKESADLDNREEAEQRQVEVEETVRGGDDAVTTVRGEGEEKLDEMPATEKRAALDTEESPRPDDDNDELNPEEEVEARGDGAIGETHHFSMIGVECPLCSVVFHIDQIEAHASGCNGPASPQPEDDKVGVAQAPGKAAVDMTAGLVLGQLNSDRKPAALNNNESLAGPSTAGTPLRRNPAAVDESVARPTKVVAAERLPGDVPLKHNSYAMQESVFRKRPDPDRGVADESSKSFSESTDHLDASLLQLVEDHQLKLRERKRGGAPDRPAKRQKLCSADDRSESSKDTESTELCFICHQRVPKSGYAEHVQEEVDRAEAGESRLVDPSVPPRRELRSRAAAPKATGGQQSSREADLTPEESGTASGMGYSADENSSCWDGEPDSDSDDCPSSAQTAGALFNPRVSESPIKAFRPISKQPTSLIDFKNQFHSGTETAAAGRRSGTRSGSARGKAGGRRRQRKAQRRGKREWKKGGR